MKRPRLLSNEVTIEYPKILLILSTGKKEMPVEAYQLTPYMANECSHLLTTLRNEKDKETLSKIVKALLAITLSAYPQAIPELLDHYALDHACLTDTKKNEIGVLRRILVSEIWKLPPCHVEFVDLNKKDEIDSSFSDTLTSSEEDSD